jgi:putative ABC transport system substrate-binding protein
MRRREFISLLGAAAWPLAARAQQTATKIPRIGIIDDAPNFNHFREALHDLGYIEGQTIAFEYRTAEGEPERLAAAAAELARLPVDDPPLEPFALNQKRRIIENIHISSRKIER